MRIDDIGPVAAPPSLPVEATDLTHSGAALACAAVLLVAVHQVRRPDLQLLPAMLGRSDPRGAFAFRSAGGDGSCAHGGRYGDPCFVCFWTAEQKVFARWAARICHYYGVGEMTEDVLAHAAEHLFRRWQDGPPIDNPQAYLRRTLERQACDVRRGRGAGRGRHQRADMPLDGMPETPAQGVDPLRHAENGDLSRQLGAALDHLTCEQREVVVCRLVLDLSTRETAEQLALTSESVSSTLYRARRALRKLLPPTLLADYDDRGDQQ